MNKDKVNLIMDINNTITLNNTTTTIINKHLITTLPTYLLITTRTTKPYPTNTRAYSSHFTMDHRCRFHSSHRLRHYTPTSVP